MVFSTRKVIDWDLGANLFGGSQEAAREMLEELCRELPLYKQQLLTLLEKRDVKKLQDVAHKLYGGTCYSPTPRLKDAVKDLENTLMNSRDEDLTENVNRVCQEIEAVLSYNFTKVKT